MWRWWGSVAAQLPGRMGTGCPLQASAVSATGGTRLKFGVDRILSEEVGPAVCRPPSASSSTNDHRKNRDTEGGGWLSCDGCLSVRHCLASSSLTADFRQLRLPSVFLHMPTPIRPFPPKLQGKVGYGLTDDDESMRRGLHAGLSQSVVGGAKRKRSWSRAVFSSLQRKGLEKRFQLQQYITKPDRRQLAASLGLTDAQVKVWFQNRRMKWRHTKELKSGVPCQQRLSPSCPPFGQQNPTS